MSFYVINPNQTFYDSTGTPRAGGFVTFFVNTTSTKGSIYSDEALTVAQANPYELDASGRMIGDVKYSGLMTMQVTNSDGSDVSTNDNVSTVETSSSLRTDLAASGGSDLVGFIQSGTGAVARTVQDKDRDIVSALDFVTVGDGVADDTTGLLNAIATGASVHLGLNKLYLVTAPLTLASQQLYLNGSELRFSVADNVKCLIMQSETKTSNGVVRNIGTGAVTGGNNPIEIGSYTSLDATYNAVIEDVVVTNTTTGASNGIYVFSNAYNIKINNIVFTDSSTLAYGIACEWGFDGADITNGSGHPNNVKITNIRMGVMTALVYGLWIAGVTSAEIDNFHVVSAPSGSIMNIWPGDYAYTYAPDPIKDIIPSIRISNVTGRALGGGSIHFLNTLGPVLKTWPTQVTVKNMSVFGLAPSNSSSKGLNVDNVSGVEIENSHFEEFYNGLFFGTAVTNTTFRNTAVINSYADGLDADNNPDSYNIGFIRNRFEGNGTGGGTIYDMRIGSSVDKITFDGNYFNSPLATTAIFSLGGAVKPTRVSVINNRVDALKSGQVCFSIGAAADYEILEEFSNNTKGPNVDGALWGGQKLAPSVVGAPWNDQNNRKVYFSPTFTAATVGTYVAGDVIFNSAPAPSGFIGWSITTSGHSYTYTEGLTATTDGTATVVLSGTTTDLVPLQFVTINATDVQIISISGTSMVVSATIGAAAGAAIAYTAFAFKTFGVISA